MSLAAATARVAEIQALLAPRPAPAPATTPAPTATGLTSSFAGQLSTAVATGAAPGAIPVTTAGGTPAGQAMIAAAQAEVGQAEMPPGSNDSLRISQYRQATAGSGVGPWCAYFVSWAARQAGVPLGDQGQGFGSVDDVATWAQRAGKALPNGPGVVPQPGDLIVWDEHIGLVESVDPDGSVHTIEGNSSDAVSRRTYAPGARDALMYVRLG